MNNSVKTNIKYSLVQCCFWMEGCIFQGYATVYLQGLSYSNSTLGVILALGHLIGFILSPVAAVIVDRNSKIKPTHINYILISAEIITLLFLEAFPYKCLLTSVSYALFGSFGLIINAMNLKISVDLDAFGYQINYGLARGFGSLAYVVVSSLLGVLIERYSVLIQIDIAIIIAIIQLISNVFISAEIDSSQMILRNVKDSLSLVSFVLKYKWFMVFLIGNTLILFAHKTDYEFLFNIVKECGGTTRELGYLNGFTAILEIPVMFLYRRISKKTHAAKALQIAFVMFSIKTLLVALAKSIPLLFFGHSFQLLSYGLYTPAIVDYVTKEVPYEDSAKAQSLTFNASILAAVLSSAISGRLFDNVSVSRTMFISFWICVVGGIVSVISLKKSEKSTLKCVQ